MLLYENVLYEMLPRLSVLYEMLHRQSVLSKCYCTKMPKR